MARFSPPLSQCKIENDAERLVAERLEHFLPDYWWVWFAPELGGQRPDLVCLHPELGLLVIEVKAWSSTYIREVRDREFHMHDGKRLESPLKQASRYALAINNRFQREPTLMKDGRCRVFYDIVIALPNLSRAEYRARQLDNVLDSRVTLLEDDFSLAAGHALENRLIEVIGTWPSKTAAARASALSEMDVKLIDGILNPRVAPNAPAIASAVLVAAKETSTVAERRTFQAALLIFFLLGLLIGIPYFVFYFRQGR